jgi:hypothetical protein
MEPAAKSSEIQRHLAELAPSTGGAVGGALVGVAVGGPPGVVVGAVAGAVVEHVAREALARRRQRAAEAIEIAADETGLSAVELLERFWADDRLHELAAAVIAAAAETDLQARIRAAGKALGRGVRDDAVIDQERFIVATLATLQMPHYRLLQQLGERYEGYGQERDADGQEPIHGWTPGALREHQPRLVPVLGPVMSALASQDLVRNTMVGRYGYTPGEADRWVLTDYGRRVLARLMEAQGDEPPDSSAQQPAEG